MNEKNWFAALTIKRQNTVETLKEQGLNSFISHILSTYNNPAHFIYGLLQNADDAKATKVRLELKKNGVLFTHNGTVGFSVSDPELERNTRQPPGHINAVTAFALSGKKNELQYKIGKFGIGFKSVFQYTGTPHIYNPPYCFKIEKIIVPIEIPVQKELLYDNETTAFWLPFDKPGTAASQAYEAIANLLAGLKNPLLFLGSIKTFDVVTPAGFTRFFKKVEDITPNLSADYIKTLCVTLNNDTLIIFNQKVKITDSVSETHFLPISVGFILDENGHITSAAQYDHYFKYAHCFFPTRHQTRINYILHAPFMLTPNREKLKDNCKENKQLTEALAGLTAAAIQNLNDMGYVNDNFNKTLPVLEYITTDFRPIAEAILNKAAIYKQTLVV